ncbi:MAG: 30S ribosomal protein S3 [Candidatus Beckwithbacteria bacterium]
MGQKVHTKSFRIGPLYTRSSNWFATKKDYQKFLLEDIQLRKFLFSKLELAGITEVKIERSINTIKFILHVSRPGVVIGRGGSGIEELKKILFNKLKFNKQTNKAPKFELEVVEVKKPDLSARLIGLRIADQMLKRYPHRRAISQALERAMTGGAKGVKIVLAGRINGAEIGRTEKYSKGSVPLSTIRSDIDYFEKPALTKFGYVGIKVWVYKGELNIV